MTNYSIKKIDSGMWKIYQKGIRRFVAIVMIIDEKIECVNRKAGFSSELVLDIYKELA